MTDKLERIVYRTRGGMLSVAELRLLAEAATAQGTGRLLATERQEIVLRGLGLNQARRLLGQPPDAVLRPWPIASAPNITTTAPVAGLDNTSAWLSEGAFGDLLNAFAVAPLRSVTLADPAQPYLPAFLGEITFLAMAERDLWRIRLALREAAEPWLLPGVVRSKDIPKAVQAIEDRVNSSVVSDAPDAMRALVEDLESLSLPAPSSAAYLPGRYRSPPGALNITIPEDGLRSDFCLDLCVWAARRTGVSVGLTPWRTLLVRGVSESDRAELRALLIRRKVAEARGGWRPYFFSSSRTDGTEWLCDALGARCPVDAGISIGVVSANAPAPDVQVLVRKSPAALWGRIAGQRYTVERCDSMNARAGQRIPVATGIHKRDLCAAVVRAIESITNSPAETVAGTAPAIESAPVAAPVHSCRSCFTEYDAAYGDPLGAIAPGMDFSAVPETWTCPVCGGPKSAYASTVAA